MRRKLLSVLLAMLMVLGLLPTMAFAADTGKAIQLVNSGTAANISGGQASSVYFGTYQQSSDGNDGYNTDPVKWRVLSNADGKLFLLSDQNLDVFKYHTDSENVTWETSTMRSWLNGYNASLNTGGSNGIDYTNDNFLNTAFYAKEQTAVADTAVVNDKNPTYQTDGGNDTTDKIFLLSIAEANNSSYFPNGNSSRISTNTAYVADGGKIGGSFMDGAGKAGVWWLRSPGFYQNRAAYVNSGGSVAYLGDGVSFGSDAVRPAFNLNLNSVLFTSAAVGGKSASGMDSGLTAVPEYTGTDWKLTLSDSSRSFKITRNTVTGTSGGTVTLNYTGATVGDNEYISVILADSNGSLIHYGRVLKPTTASGTMNIAIPEGLAGGTYTLHVFSEQYNGDYKTDYASAFDDVTLTVHSHAWSADWSGDETAHWYDCTAANCPITDNSKKDGYAEHSGGTASCTAKAVCTNCGKEYGDLAPHQLTKVDAKAATETANGNIEYWYCEDCDKYYADKDAQTEITKEDTITTWSAVPATGLTLSEKEQTLVPNGRIPLSATVAPANSTDSVTWSSSDPTVATVSDTGEVKAVGYGTAVITAKAGDKITTCKITVVCGTDKCQYYDDVEANEWYHPAVDYVTQVGIMQGKGNKIFEPDVTLTRAEMAQILYNYEKNVVKGGKEPENGKTTINFTDLKSGEWYEKAIAWASSNDIIEGDGVWDGNTFRPDDSVSREEMVTMLYRYMVDYLGCTDFPQAATGNPDWKSFQDCEAVADWAETAFAWAVKHGIIDGDDGRLNPQSTATRAQAAKIIMVAVKQ